MRVGFSGRWFFVGLIALIGCPTSPEPSTLAVTTDRTRYSGSANDDIVIHGAIRNASTSQYFLSHCGEDIAATLQKLNNGQWISFEVRTCPAFYQPAAVLSPGQTLAFDLRLRAGPQVQPDDLNGQFRIIVNAFLSEEGARMHNSAFLVPDSERTSAAFEIVAKE